LRFKVKAEHFRVFGLQVCIQAGLPPNMAPDLYPSLVRAIKKEVPAMHIHAFSPEEVRQDAT
jgi:FO synthase subunit 2